MAQRIKRYKGCCRMCATFTGAIRGNGTARRAPFRDLRKLGRKRRLSRHGWS